MAVTEDCVEHDLGELMSALVSDERIASQLGSCVSDDGNDEMTPESGLNGGCGCAAVQPAARGGWCAMLLVGALWVLRTGRKRAPALRGSL